MTQFDDRERALERRFGMEEEEHFRQNVRAARLFAKWAATQMSMKDAELEAYAVQIGDIAIDKPGHEAILAAVEKDFEAKGLHFTRHHLEKEWNTFDRAASHNAVND